MLRVTTYEELIFSYSFGINFPFSIGTYETGAF